MKLYQTRIYTFLIAMVYYEFNLVLNAENAALKSPKFALLSARAREGILLNHIQRATSLIEKPIGSSRHAKSPSTVSDPSGSPKGDETTLEFNLPDKSALGRGRPNMLPGLSRRRSTHEAGGHRAKPWISRNKKGKGYSRDQGILPFNMDCMYSRRSMYAYFVYMIYCSTSAKSIRT